MKRSLNESQNRPQFFTKKTFSMPWVNASFNLNASIDYFSSLASRQMRCLVGKPTMWFLNRSDTNQPVTEAG